MTTIAPMKTKNVFTRITLDPVSMQAVQKIQAILPNYDLNDAVKMLLGIGIKNIDNVISELNLDKYFGIIPDDAQLQQFDKDLEKRKKGYKTRELEL